MSIITVVQIGGNVPVLNLDKLDKAADRFDGDLECDLTADDGITATVEFCTEEDKRDFDKLIKRGDVFEGLSIKK